MAKKMIALLLAAIHLAHETVVEKLRGLGSFGFRNGFREKIQNALKPRLGGDELAAKAGFLIKFVAAVEDFVVGFLVVLGDDLHRERFVGVVALDARSHRS